MRTCTTFHAVAIPAIVGCAFAAGCSKPTETFPGKSRDQVWTALLRTAEAPVYDDWHVIENDVWGYEADGRIEIWRLLRRYKDPGGQWPRLEDREWKFTVTLLPTDPPSATFDVRTFGVPSYGWPESPRYFDQVWLLLGGRPLGPPVTAAGPALDRPPEPAPSAEKAGDPTLSPAPTDPRVPETPPVTEPEKPPVDIPT